MSLTKLGMVLPMLLLIGGAWMQDLSTAQEITIKVKPAETKPADDDPAKTAEATGKAPFTGKRPAADVAILLDTSNSMDGLISQAKSQLWTIVQEFANAKKAGKTPALRVSVFEYGNTSLPASEGYIRQVVGLTDDLDKVSEALFSLTTNGGDEYCGQVINEALSRLDWSKEANAYKAIFIAGNEPFTQGEVDYQKSCKRAIESGVVVNTIHCGNRNQGIAGKWQHGAKMTEGEYINIDQDRAVIAIKTPQDKILIELNGKLNRTYLWYGTSIDRKKYSSNQAIQDTNAFQQQGAFGLGNRALVKGGSAYSNLGRDLVDTFKDNKNILTEVDEKHLPESIKKLSADKRVDAIAEMSKRRTEIQKEIAKITIEREKFIAAKKKSLPKLEADQSTLGDAVQGTIREQLKSSGFKFKK